MASLVPHHSLRSLERLRPSLSHLALISSTLSPGCPALRTAAWRPKRSSSTSRSPDIRHRPTFCLARTHTLGKAPSHVPGSSQTVCAAVLIHRSLRHASSRSDDPSRQPTAPVIPKKVKLRTKLKEKLQQTLPHENIYTLPNILTFSRLICTPAIGYFIISNQPYIACALFAYAGVTDLLDGWIARRWKLQTVVGTVIDPLADKTLMTVLTVCLAVQGALPIWVATLILGRDASLAVAAVYYRFASLPKPRTMARYWDFSLPSAEVHPTNISKLNTLLQLLLIGMTIALPLVSQAGVSEVALPLPTTGTENEGGWLTKVDLGQAVWMAQCTVATTTVWSGLSYLYTRDAVKILGEQMDAAKKRGIVRRGRGIIGVCFLVCAGVAVGLERTFAAQGQDEKQQQQQGSYGDGVS